MEMLNVIIASKVSYAERRVDDGGDDGMTILLKSLLATDSEQQMQIERCNISAEVNKVRESVQVLSFNFLPT